MATEVSPMQPTSVEEPADDEHALIRMDHRAGHTNEVYVESVRHDITEARAQVLAQSFSIASVGTSLGFALARAGTELGFGIARGVLQATDALLGDVSKPATAPIAAALNVSQALAFAGISVGEQAAGVGLTAASSSLTTLNEFYGNGESVRALAAFARLFQREWNEVLDSDPPGGMAQYSLRKLLRAMSCWALLQSCTNHLDPFDYTRELTQLAIRHNGEAHLAEQAKGETIFEYAAAEAAEGEEAGIDEAEIKGATRQDLPEQSETEGARLAFRRYAALCLGSYGGLGLLFLGVPIPNAPDDSLGEGDAAHKEPFSYWNILRGAHDRELLERLGSLPAGSVHPDEEKTSIPQGRRPPRHFIITDHPGKAISLCLRGTLTIDDVATDLACEEASFPLPPAAGTSTSAGEADESAHYTVHGGMLEVATEFGRRDGPVVRRLAQLLREHPGYGLHIVGHSLGAGIACLLALLWADPDTALTKPSYPFPADVPVTAYCFATPAVTSAALSRRLRPKLVRSIVLGDDIVPRFSLGHMRDLRSAAAWICAAETSVVDRVFEAGKRSTEDDLELDFDEQDFLSSFRKTLEANMQHATLFPPGQVFLLRPSRKNQRGVVCEPELFEVTGAVEHVFKQIKFGSGIFSDHMPHSASKHIASYV